MVRDGHGKLRVLGSALVGLGFALVSVAAGPVQAQGPAPRNDRIGDAELVAGPSLLLADTAMATTEPDEPVPPCAPLGPAPIRRTVWYRVTAWDSDLLVATTGGTGLRPIMALYASEPTGALTPVACSVDWSMRASVSAGQVLYLQVGQSTLPGGLEGGRLHLLVGPSSPETVPGR